MELTRLKIMLPYLNDEYKVGELINHCNQASASDNKKEVDEFGKVTEIEDCADGVYMIHFETGKYKMICDTPVQLDITNG